MEPWPNLGKGQLRFSSQGRVGRAGVEILCGSTSGVGGLGERNASYLGYSLEVFSSYLAPPLPLPPSPPKRIPKRAKGLQATPKVTQELLA